MKTVSEERRRERRIEAAALYIRERLAHYWTREEIRLWFKRKHPDLQAVPLDLLEAERFDEIYDVLDQKDDWVPPTWLK